MNLTAQDIQDVLIGLAKCSFHASVLIGVILLVRAFLRGRYRLKAVGWLWMILVLRLMWPFQMPGSVSVFTMIPEAYEPFHYLSSEKSRDNLGHMPAFNAKTPVAVPAESPHGPDRPGHAAEPSGAGEGNHENNAMAAHERYYVDWPTVLCAMYLVVASILSLIMLWSNVRLWRLVKSERAVTDRDILEVLESCKSRLKLRSPVRLVETALTGTPCLFGCLRPCLLLPKGVTRELSEKQLRFIFLHELSHLKQHDILVRYLMAFISILHWFNPLVWLAMAKMQNDREMACDGMVLSHIKEHESRQYGATLLFFLERFVQQKPLAGMAGIVARKQLLKRRLNMILTFKKQKNSILPVLILAALFVCMTFMTAQPFSGDSPEERVSEEKIPEKININTVGMSQGIKPPAIHIPGDTKLGKRLAETTITMQPFKDAPLETVINQIRGETGLPVVIDQAVNPYTTTVSVALSNASLHKAIDLICDNAGLSAVFHVGMLVICTPEQFSRYRGSHFRLLTLPQKKPDVAALKLLDEVQPWKGKPLTRQVTLNDILADIKKACGLNVYLAGEARECSGKKIAMPILNEEMTAHIILKIALDAACEEDIGYRMENGVLVVGAMPDSTRRVCLPLPEGAGEDRAFPLHKLETTRIDLNFKGKALADVIDFMGKVMRVNIIFDREVDGKRFMVDVCGRGYQARRALDILMIHTGLTYVIRNNVITITKRDRVITETLNQVLWEKQVDREDSERVSRKVKELKIHAISFDNRSLDEILEYLHTISGIPLLLDAHARQGAKGDERITVPEARAVTFEELLNRIVSRTKAPANQWCIYKGVIFIGKDVKAIHTRERIQDLSRKLEAMKARMVSLDKRLKRQMTVKADELTQLEIQYRREMGWHENSLKAMEGLIEQLKR